MDKVLGRDHRYHMYIDVTTPSFHGRCSYKEFRKWKDRMDAIFDGDYYSEREKVKIAARTFDDDTFEWWDEEKRCRHFYGYRPFNTWYELTEMLRKRLHQNIDEELRAGMDKIKSLFSQWKESSPNPDKVSNINVKTP